MPRVCLQESIENAPPLAFRRARRAAKPTLYYCIGLICFAVVAPRAGVAQVGGLEETDDIPAVQNRKYRNEHEFGVGIGVLPVDPLTKGLALRGTYGWHVSDLWSIELSFSYLRNFKTSLREDLENGHNRLPTEFVEFKWFGEAGLLFKPIYGRLALLNNTLVYGEVYLSAHGVVAQLDGGEPTEEELQGKGARLGFGGAPGFGVRGYLNQYLSLRIDFRTLLVLSAGELRTPLSLTFSFAATTRSDL